MVFNKNARDCRFIGSDAIMTLFYIVVLIAILKSSSSNPPIHGFQAGRIPEGVHEFNSLNGVMTPEAAVKICEAEPECAGFTYKGLLPSKIPDTKSREYPVFFFGLVPYVLNTPDFLNWVTFLTFNNFGRITGIPGESSYLMAEKITTKEECILHNECAGLVIHDEEVEAYSYIDFNTMNRNVSSSTTLVNFVADGSLFGGNRILADFNPCCESMGIEDINDYMKWASEVRDSLERIDCNQLSPDEFETRYVIPRKAVMLVNCSEHWGIRQDWTIRGLLKRYPDDISWTAGYRYNDGRPNDQGRKKWMKNIETDFENENRSNELDGEMTGEDIIRIMDTQNVSIRIFERIGLPPELHDIPESKLDLFEGWSKPGPIPLDLFSTAMKIFTDYTWIIMGHPGTGTHLHNDPALTDAWNTLLYGHKYWVLLPIDSPYGFFECEMSCSPDHDDIIPVSWYSNIVPQLRKKEWYGNPIIETIQGPGETIYVPHSMPHAVLNLDENLSLTQNYMGKNALDELAKYYALKWNPVKHYPESSLEKAWTNIMSHLPKDDRIYIRNIYQQIMTNL